MYIPTYLKLVMSVLQFQTPIIMWKIVYYTSHTNTKKNTKSFEKKPNQLNVTSSVKILSQGVQATTTTTSSALTSCPALFPRSFFKHCLHILKQLIHMHHQLFVYILPNHPYSGSYGGKTAQVWNLW